MTFSVTLGGDTQEEFIDAIEITHGKSGEVVLIYRAHILCFSGRTRVIKEKVRATRNANGADRWWATSRRSGSDVTPPSAPTVAATAASQELAAWVPPERSSRY